MEVHVTDITTTDSRIRESDLGIQIRSVEIDLTAILMYDVARFLHTVFKHAVSRWVRDLRDNVR